MTDIAFIGLGKMGSPMVKNLLKIGHRLKIFDISAEAIERLVIDGATACHSIAEAVMDVQVVFTMLQTGAQVRDVCVGEQGIFANMLTDALYIDCSSIDIDSTRELHVKAKQARLIMIDAPVSGGVKGAEAASLTIMVGGEVKAFERAKPFLQALGKTIIHAGSAGNGQVAKICNNMILGISMIAVSEAFCLAEKLGLEAKKLFEVSSHASGQCWAMTNYCPVPGILADVPANNQYRPGFTAAMMLKDLNLSQDAAKTAGINTQLAEKATQLYQRFFNEDHGDMDFSGIFTMICSSNSR